MPDDQSLEELEQDIKKHPKSNIIFYGAIALVSLSYWIGYLNGSHKSLHPQTGLLATGIEIGYVAHAKGIPLSDAMRVSLSNLPYKRADQWQIYWTTNAHQLTRP